MYHEQSVDLSIDQTRRPFWGECRDGMLKAGRGGQVG